MYLLEWQKKKNFFLSDTTKCQKGYRTIKHSYNAGETAKCKATLKSSFIASHKLNIHLPYDLEIPLLGIYPMK